MTRGSGEQRGGRAHRSWGAVWGGEGKRLVEGGEGGKMRKAEVPCSLSCQVEERLPGEVGDVGEDMVGGWGNLIRRCG